jgi:hypothetical protein
VFAQLEAAAGADPEATEMLAEHDELRHQTQRRLAHGLHRRGQLKPGLSAGEAADAVWTLASERTYLALVRDRGWTAQATRAGSPSSSSPPSCRRVTGGGSRATSSAAVAEGEQVAHTLAEQTASRRGLVKRWREWRRFRQERTGDSPEKLGTKHTPKRDAIDMWLRSGGVERESRFEK